MTFTDLPDMGNGLRLAGTTIVDEEQWTVEQWHDYRGELRPTVAGIHAYAQLREARKAQRHDSWKHRQEADDEWSREMQRVTERTP